MKFVRLLCPAAKRVQPTVAELTFDLTGVSVSRLHRYAIYRAREYTELEDAVEKKTVYIGSPRSQTAERCSRELISPEIWYRATTALLD